MVTVAEEDFTAVVVDPVSTAVGEDFTAAAVAGMVGEAGTVAAVVAGTAEAGTAADITGSAITEAIAADTGDTRVTAGDGVPDGASESASDGADTGQAIRTGMAMRLHGPLLITLTTIPLRPPVMLEQRQLQTPRTAGLPATCPRAARDIARLRMQTQATLWL